MMPGIAAGLHVGGGISGGVASLLQALTLASSYSSSEGVSGGATLTFTFKSATRDWAITRGAGDTGSGTPLTGTWLDGAGTPGDYEIKFTPGGANAPTSNGAASFTAMSADRAVSWTAGPGVSKTASLTIDIRKISDTSDAVTDTVTSIAVDGTPV